MTELEAIRARHSVRSYQQRTIEPEKIAELRALIDQCNAESGLHIQLLEDAGNAFNRVLHKLTGLGTAPSAIAIAGPDTPDLDERGGYYGQRVVLRAQQLGLNTCWVGMYRKDGVPVQLRAGERLSIVVALGYGVNPGRERKSKSPDQVTVVNAAKPEWFDRAVEAALLAPTAINQQKFLITLNADGSVTFTDKGGPYSKTDIGIVKYNFDVGRKG